MMLESPHLSSEYHSPLAFVMLIKTAIPFQSMSRGRGTVCSGMNRKTGTHPAMTTSGSLHVEALSPGSSGQNLVRL